MPRALNSCPAPGSSIAPLPASAMGRINLNHCVLLMHYCVADGETAWVLDEFAAVVQAHVDAMSAHEKIELLGKMQS